MSLPGKVVIELFSGVEARITPLSPDTMELVRQAQLSIEPDWEKEFEKPISEQDQDESAITFDPDATFIDRSDPGYAGREKEVKQLRSDKFYELVLDICVEFDRPKDQLIKEFAERISTMRKHFKDAIPEDDWQATLHHAVILRAEEWMQISAVAMQRAAITQEEVNDAMRIFRPVVSGARLLDINQQSPRIHDQSKESTG